MEKENSAILLWRRRKVTFKAYIKPEFKVIGSLGMHTRVGLLHAQAHPGYLRIQPEDDSRPKELPMEFTS